MARSIAAGVGAGAGAPQAFVLVWVGRHETLTLCSQALSPSSWLRVGCASQKERSTLLRPSQGLGRLTHTKCSLGVQFKALRTANLVLFCKAKGKTLREPVPQSILGFLSGLVQAVSPDWEPQS